MPTLKEIKDMLKEAEAKVEAGVESLFQAPVDPVDPQVAAETQVVTEEPAPATVDEPVFDSGKPFGWVDGVQGVKYQQDGAYFNSQRKFVRKG
jgi:hypothetical protein